MSEIIIRRANKNDCPSLLPLMKQLAIFEGYIDDFKVTVDDLIRHGFPTEGDPNFTAIVAENVAEKDQLLLAYLVYYLIPFTYDLKPTLFIKELFVDQSARGQGVGKALMQRAIEDAKYKQCGRIKWDVLTDNTRAQSFYQSLGAVHDRQWLGYLLVL